MSAVWSRRRVLGTTLGAAGAALVAQLMPRPAAAGGDLADTATARLIVVQDGRYPSSRRHAEALARQAHLIIDAGEDVARLWYRGLAASAARTPLAFAGLTTWSDFVVLRGCAAEAGLRRSRHELVRDTGGNGCTLVRWQIGRVAS
jgi:hypothetical protein